MLARGNRNLSEAPPPLHRPTLHNLPNKVQALPPPERPGTRPLRKHRTSRTRNCKDQVSNPNAPKHVRTSKPATPPLIGTVTLLNADNWENEA